MRHGIHSNGIVCVGSSVSQNIVSLDRRHRETRLNQQDFSAMDRTPGSVTDVERSLWCCLMCQCERCQKCLDLDEFEELADSPLQWAEAVAPFVKSQGWSAPCEWTLLCEECTRQESS